MTPGWPQVSPPGQTRTCTAGQTQHSTIKRCSLSFEYPPQGREHLEDLGTCCGKTPLRLFKNPQTQVLVSPQFSELGEWCARPNTDHKAILFPSSAAMALRCGGGGGSSAGWLGPRGKCSGSTAGRSYLRPPGLWGWMGSRNGGCSGALSPWRGGGNRWGGALRRHGGGGLMALATSLTGGHRWTASWGTPP